MRSIIHMAVAFCCVLMGVAAAQAQSDVMDKLVDELQAHRARLPKMEVETEKEKKRLDQENTRLKREETTIKNARSPWLMEQADVEQEKARILAAGCRPGQKTTDLALARRCNSMTEHVNGRTDKLEADGQALLARIKGHKTAQDKLSTDTANWAAKTKQLAEIRSNIAAIEARLKAVCPSVPLSGSAEAMKHACGNVQFDGAKPELGPCKTPACLEFDRRFKK